MVDQDADSSSDVRLRGGGRLERDHAEVIGIFGCNRACKTDANFLQQKMKNLFPLGAYLLLFLGASLLLGGGGISLCTRQGILPP